MKTLQQYIIEQQDIFDDFKPLFEDDLLGGDEESDSSDDGSDSSDNEEGDDEDMKPQPDPEKKEKREEDEKQKERAEIKFTIWQTPEKKLRWLKKGDNYQKIEYKYEDKKTNMYVDFLLGEKDNVWHLWVGKIGACSYDDNPYCSLETKSFNTAIINALDKVQEMLQKIKDDKLNYIQFYKNL